MRIVAVAWVILGLAKTGTASVRNLAEDVGSARLGRRSRRAMRRWLAAFVGRAPGSSRRGDSRSVRACACFKAPPPRGGPRFQIERAPRLRVDEVSL